VYHEPFKDTCIESDIVIDDCNKHAQTSESTISYKHVNFCGSLRACEKSHDKEDYCIHHRNEETRMWDKALDELGERFVPFILLFVNFAMKRVILIFNAQAIIMTFLIQ
jgi:hypothetical protein